MKKFFFVYLHSYTWQTFSVYALELSLFTSHGQTLFTFKDLFRFSPTHTYGSYKSFFIYTRCSHTQEFLYTYFFYKNPSMHIFLFLYIRRHFIHNTSFFFIMILVHFIFRTTFLNEKNSTRFRNFYKHYWQQRNKYWCNNSNDMYVQNKSQSTRNKR